MSIHWVSRCGPGLVTAVLIVYGCETRAPGGGSSEVAEVLEWDSAGITIVETSGKVARSPLSWSVSTSPVLEIGGQVGREEYLFSRIGGLVRPSDTRIVVSDGASRELRVYDREGQFSNRFGGEGEGPGEFTGAPSLVPSGIRDSLVVFDIRLQRFSVFTLEGDLLGTYNVPELPTTPIELPWGGTSSLRILTGGAGIAGDRILGYRTVSLLGEPGTVMPPEPFELLYLDLVGGEASQLGLYDGEQSFRTETDEFGQTGMFQVPFDVTPSVATHAGAVYLTVGDRPEVRQFNAVGNLERIIRLREESRPIAAQDLDAFIAERQRTAPSQAVSNLYDRIYREVPLPEAMPSFQALFVDDLGWIWAQAYQPGTAATAEWIVFDMEGRGVGSVEVPSRLDVYQIGEDYIMGTWSDELDVEYVREYRLTRSR